MVDAFVTGELDDAGDTTGVMDTTGVYESSRSTALLHISPASTVTAFEIALEYSPTVFETPKWESSDTITFSSDRVIALDIGGPFFLRARLVSKVGTGIISVSIG